MNEKIEAKTKGDEDKDDRTSEAGPTPPEKDGNLMTCMNGPIGAASREYSTSCSPSPKYCRTYVIQSKTTPVKDADEASTENNNLETVDAGQGPIPPEEDSNEMRTEDEDLQVSDADQSSIPLAEASENVVGKVHAGTIRQGSIPLAEASDEDAVSKVHVGTRPQS